MTCAREPRASRPGSCAPRRPASSEHLTPGVPGGRRRVGRLGGGGRRGRAGGFAPGVAARVDRRDHRLVGGRVRAPCKRFGHPEGGLDGLPAALPLRVPLGQSSEGFDPAVAAGGERHDRPERQPLQLIELEVRAVSWSPPRVGAVMAVAGIAPGCLGSGATRPGAAASPRPGPRAARRSPRGVSGRATGAWW